MTSTPPDPDIVFSNWIGQLMDLEDFDATGDETVNEAIEALSALGEPFIPKLINAMAHDYFSVHLAAERVLVRLGPGTAPWLIESLEHHPSVAVRVTVAHIFYEWFAHAADDRMRGTAAQKLVAFNPNPPERVPELRKAPKAAIPSLTKALRDEDWEVRLWAARALSEAGTDAATAVPVLLKFLREAEAEADDKAEYYAHTVEVRGSSPLTPITQSLI